jgi:ABC-type sugar transport system ATPase subunit
MKPFLRVTDLTKGYPGVVAVDGASFDISAGEVVGLLGKNGAGKSTVIRILAGTVHPDAGAVEVDGQPVAFKNPQAATRSGISVVHQEMNDVPLLSVAENVGLGHPWPKRLGMVRWRELRAQVAAVLERLDMPLAPDAVVADLSIAERRMVMIAAALFRNARLVVLDEPTASLTNPEIERLHRVIRSLKQHNVAFLYVTHRLSEVFEICDRVIVMRDGAITAQETVQSVDHARLVKLIAGNDAKATSTRTNAQSPSRGGSDELLRAEGLTRDDVITDVSLTLRAGEILGLGGLVGSGRTELARLLAGADLPTSGRIFVRGEAVRLRSPADALALGIALLPEDRRNHALIRDFGIGENITLPNLRRLRALTWLPVPSAKKQRQVTQEQVKDLAIVTSDLEKPVTLLSGGNQQKVALARWLFKGSDVLIFDEPTQGTDVALKEEFFRRIKQLAAAGKGIILISSELSELESVCSRVAVLRDGRIVDILKGPVTEDQILEACYA